MTKCFQKEKNFLIIPKCFMSLYFFFDTFLIAFCPKRTKKEAKNKILYTTNDVAFIFLNDSSKSILR